MASIKREKHVNDENQEEEMREEDENTSSKQQAMEGVARSLGLVMNIPTSTQVIQVVSAVPNSAAITLQGSASQVLEQIASQALAASGANSSVLHIKSEGQKLLQGLSSPYQDDGRESQNCSPESQGHSEIAPLTIGQSVCLGLEQGLQDDQFEDKREAGGGKAKRPRIIKEDKTMLCLVCGDKALGCNFDAISCESCKAFFRRNALKEKRTKCLFHGNCKIEVNTRRFCPHCRIQKCLAVGMKRELILGDDERKKRMEKVMTNREKKVIGNHRRKSVSKSVPSPTITSPAPAVLTEEIPEATTPVSEAVVTVETVQQPIVEQQAVGSEPLPTLSPMPCQYGNLVTAESTNLLCLSKFVRQNDGANNATDSNLMRAMTAEETAMLNELMQVYDLSFTADLEPLIHIKQCDPSLNQLVNQSSITVLRLIKFAKRLEEFVRLSQECQIGILKGSWIHILLLRSISVYDCERDIWVTPRSQIPTNILKNATGFVQLHDDHVRYCKSIKAIIRDDLMIVVILLAIVLFSPEGPHVIMRDLVSNIQDKYLVLLKHYLESKYTFLGGAEMFPQLMSKLKELKELAEDHGKVLLEVNPREIEPFMLEILDLK